MVTRMTKRFRFIFTYIVMLMILGACSNSNDDASNKKEVTSKSKSVELTISAAVSLKDAMDVIQTKYQEVHPEVKLKFNYGSSGSLQQQISQGAPVDLFFSAAEDKFDLLVEEGMIAKADGTDLLGNEIVLVVPKESSIKGFQDLKKADVGKISAGTPESVPAGKYGKESLEKMGIWKDVESKIVYAKDVRQVLSYVETGNVDAGIVYKTDALVSEKVVIAETADPQTHSPIIYPVGVIKDTKNYEAAKEFYHFLTSDAAVKVFEEYGFTIK